MTLPPRMLLRCSLLLTAFAFPLLVGCGGKKFHPRATVTGKVTIGGKPLPGGTVTFSREEDPRDSATVYIRSDGTYETESAPVGKCKVAVKTAYLNQAPPATPKPGDPPALLPKPPEHWVSISGDPKTGKVFMPIPKKYEDLDSSGLTFEVKSGSNPYDIPLDAK